MSITIAVIFLTKLNFFEPLTDERIAKIVYKNSNSHYGFSSFEEFEKLGIVLGNKLPPIHLYWSFSTELEVYVRQNDTRYRRGDIIYYIKKINRFGMVKTIGKTTYGPATFNGNGQLELSGKTHP